MKVFSINKSIGWASSGVEYAQKYRMELLRELENIEDYYIFMDYMPTNLQNFTQNMGFSDNSVIWIYNYLANRPTKASTYPVERFLESIAENFTVTEKNEKFIDVMLANKPIKYKIWLVNGGFVDRIDTIVERRLESVDHYDDRLNNRQIYLNSKPVRRIFFDEVGKVAYSQVLIDGKLAQTFIDGKILDGKSQFFQYFFRKLSSEIADNDVVILDRATDILDAVLPVFAGKKRLFAVVHAEHFNQPFSKEGRILWNNFYEYVFENAQYFEKILVSTKKQEQVLKSQLKDYKGIRTVPVGYLEEIHEREDFDKYALISASRLAPEKHIDVLIRSVALAKKQIPELRLDIYGGGKREKLDKLIADLKANEYIQLLGHKNLSQVYAGYGAYLSASTSEGFGLSLLEAQGSCLPIIGFDVNYGNREFIQDGKNGFLIKHTDFPEDEKRIAQVIVAFYKGDFYKDARLAAKTSAERFLKKEIQKRWKEILEVV